MRSRICQDKWVSNLAVWDGICGLGCGVFRTGVAAVGLFVTGWRRGAEKEPGEYGRWLSVGRHAGAVLYAAGCSSPVLQL